MRSSALALAFIPTLLHIILLSGLFPLFNWGVDGAGVCVTEIKIFSNGSASKLSFQPRAAMDEESYAERQPSPQEGMELFTKKGCVACHAIDDEAEGKLGPKMKGLFGAVRYFEDGASAMADEEYIRHSILAPGEKVVKGFQGVMPPYGDILSPDELESVILYIKSL
jgi:mono/diheme cytochrome c family protein